MSLWLLRIGILVWLLAGGDGVGGVPAGPGTEGTGVIPASGGADGTSTIPAARGFDGTGTVPGGGEGER